MELSESISATRSFGFKWGFSDLKVRERLGLAVLWVSDELIAQREREMGFGVDQKITDFEGDSRERGREREHSPIRVLGYLIGLPGGGKRCPLLPAK